MPSNAGGDRNSFSGSTVDAGVCFLCVGEASVGLLEAGVPGCSLLGTGDKCKGGGSDKKYKNQPRRILMIVAQPSISMGIAHCPVICGCRRCWWRTAEFGLGVG